MKKRNGCVEYSSGVSELERWRVPSTSYVSYGDTTVTPPSTTIGTGGSAARSAAHCARCAAVVSEAGSCSARSVSRDVGGGLLGGAG